MIAFAIAQAVAQRKHITVVLFSRCFSEQLLSDILTTLKNSLNGEKTTCFSVNDGHDIDFVFLLPTKVKSSSCSATSTLLLGTGRSSGKPSAYSLNQLATVP